MTKITVYKDGKTYYIPSSIVGYNDLVEINGTLLDNPTSSKYITTTTIKSLRLATRKNVPDKYIHGTFEMSAVDYDARIEYLTHTYKEKIDEKYDDDGERKNVCIWKDKEAEKEFYLLTNKFQCIYKPVITYGEWFSIEVISLPKSPSAYIIPDWKVNETLSTTCVLNRTTMLKETIVSLAKQFPSLEVKDYIGNYEPSIYINSTKYEITGIPRYNGGILRGTLTECVAEQTRLLAELSRYFAIEVGKKQGRQLTNVTVVLEDVIAALNKFQFVKTKVATERQYRDGIIMLKNLKLKLEEEIIS